MTSRTFGPRIISFYFQFICWLFSRLTIVIFIPSGGVSGPRGKKKLMKKLQSYLYYYHHHRRHHREIVDEIQTKICKNVRQSTLAARRF